MDIINGDCLNVMAGMDENSIDSIITDPPYGLSFMGREWDHGVPGEAFWREALRVAKPGAHLLAFGGTRTYHRLAVAIEDAGWEIRDCLGWLYGSGFPKSHDVSKAIDKAAGAEREVLGVGAADCEYLRRGEPCQGHGDVNGRYGETVHTGLTAPATPDAIRWQGWGTALKPAWEPIILARKPLTGTVANNVLAHGTGAINIDGCRVPSNGEHMVAGTVTKKTTVTGDERSGKALGMYGEGASFTPTNSPIGRFPANIIHDGSDEVLSVFPQTVGSSKPYVQPRPTTDSGGSSWSKGDHVPFHIGDSGSASRFFYCAKASKKDRGEGNNHPTVKPTDLMRYCVRLITPPNGLVLDPFMGSGSTGKAATLEGMRFVGIDLSADYCEIARKRIADSGGC